MQHPRMTTTTTPTATPAALAPPTLDSEIKVTVKELDGHVRRAFKYGYMSALEDAVHRYQAVRHVLEKQQQQQQQPDDTAVHVASATSTPKRSSYFRGTRRRRRGGAGRGGKGRGSDEDETKQPTAAQRASVAFEYFLANGALVPAIAPNEPIAQFGWPGVIEWAPTIVGLHSLDLVARKGVAVSAAAAAAAVPNGDVKVNGSAAMEEDNANATKDQPAAATAAATTEDTSAAVIMPPSVEPEPSTDNVD